LRALIHPTAIVHSGARLAADVVVGAYSIVEARVEIGAGTSIGAHCVIKGATRIGERNKIHDFVSLGAPPQDKKYQGEDTRLEIGNDNTLREFCTINRGTAQDVGTTRIGNDNWIMAYVHIAHDCQVGSHTVFANNTQLAGHVHIGDHAILGGFTGVHQFVHVGAHSFTGVATVLLQDLPAYVMASGNPAKPYGINSEGLRRRGFRGSTITEIKRAYRTLYRCALSFEDAKAQIARQREACPEVQLLLESLASTTRGIIR
jgi:UDP-N-acetylglucosamine acyltransferase